MTVCHVIRITLSYAFPSEVFRENAKTGANLVSEINSLREKGILFSLQIKVSENYG